MKAHCPLSERVFVSPPHYGDGLGFVNLGCPLKAPKRLQNQYSKSIAQTYGLTIDPLLQLHSQWLCDIKKTEQR
jgi:hypothetical protein